MRSLNLGVKYFDLTNSLEARDSQLSKRSLPLLNDDIAKFTPLVLQLATTCLQIALARLCISWGVTPSAVVGHSLGEYAALNIAGVLSDADTIYLVAKRAELLEERCRHGTHSMLAIHASTGTIKTLLAGRKYEIACINGPEDTVLGGSNEQISSL
jgi:acyl transferase domain-containing protein